MNQIKVQAPVRLSLGGGGTDVEPFSTEYGSTILSFAINIFVKTRLSSRRITGKDLTLSIISSNSRESQSKFSQSLHKALFKRIPNGFHTEIEISNPVGPGSGLGTSSSMIVSSLLALGLAQEKEINQDQIVEDALTLERKEMRIEGGFQDYYPALFGGLNWIEQPKGQNKRIRRKLAIQPKIRDLLTTKLLCVELGIPRDGEKIIQDQIQRLNSANNVTKNSLLNQLELTSTILRALEQDDIDLLLSSIEHAYDLKKKYTPMISNPNIDKVEISLMELGAKGLKVSGAGGGGHMFGFFPNGIPENIEELLPKEVRKVNCRYEEKGWRICEYA